MAKIRGPLLSQEARGKIAERLVFSLRSSGQQVRFQKAQQDIITEARTNQRIIYSEAVEAWDILSDLEKLEWKVQAGKLKFTGYNLFVQSYLDNFVFGHAKAFYGVAIFGNTIYGEI
jgi:hypothetical protein